MRFAHQGAAGMMGGTSYKKVASAKKGATLTIVSTKSGWAKDTQGRWWKLAYLKKKA